MPPGIDGTCIPYVTLPLTQGFTAVHHLQEKNQAATPRSARGAPRHS